MVTSDARGSIVSTGEVNSPLCFSEWLKCRRQELDLTQEQLARRVNYSVFAIRKIEMGERRPSLQLAGLLAQALDIPPECRDIFVKAARGELSVERLVFTPTRVVQLDAEPDEIPENLPRSLTPFIGREPELSSLGQLLVDPQCLLLTIVGPGGIGKTRLAIEAARQSQNRFPNGVWFVPLAGVTSPALLVPAIAEAVHFRFQDTIDSQAQLLRFLKKKKALLILDNAEHLLDGVGLFTDLLNACPHVKLLATSRQRLNLLSEWVFEIQGLPVPLVDQVDQLESFSSMALFLRSARRAFPEFPLDEAGRAGIANICRLVEGMPLAIELAATWVRMLSSTDIAAEIQNSLDFLSTSARDLPERHRSMRAVFDKSWEMLSPDEQQVLCRLSVFRNGFDRQAAEQVASASLSILSTLVNRTLVRRIQAQSHGAVARYDLHELIRQYSAAHLIDAPQACAAVQKQHCAYFLELVETANLELKGPNQLDWLNRLDQELPNLRAAMEWALKSSDAAQDMGELALRLAGALRWFCRMRGHFHEELGWLMAALNQSPHRPTVGRASALLGLALILNGLGDPGGAGPPAEESAAIYRDLDDEQGLAEALTTAGLNFVWQGEAALSRAQFEEALALYRKSGDRWGEARVLYRLGSFLSDYSGDPIGQEMLAESAAILEQLGEKYLFAGVLASLGILESGFGDYAAARTHLKRSLEIAQELDHPWGIADALTNLGCIDRIQGDYEKAQSYLMSAQRVYQDHIDSAWEIDALCALVDNHIAQGDLPAAQGCLQAAADLLGASENKWLQVLVLYFRGLLSYYQGDVDAAAALLEDTAVCARESRYRPDLARALVALGRARRTLGTLEQASRLTLEGLDLFRRLGHRPGIATALEELAAVRAAENEYNQAARLFSLAHSLRVQLSVPIAPVDATTYDSVIAACRSQLGESAFQEIWASTSDLPWQDVVQDIIEK